MIHSLGADGQKNLILTDAEPQRQNESGYKDQVASDSRLDFFVTYIHTKTHIQTQEN